MIAKILLLLLFICTVCMIRETTTTFQRNLFHFPVDNGVPRCSFAFFETTSTSGTWRGDEKGGGGGGRMCEKGRCLWKGIWKDEWKGVLAGEKTSNTFGRFSFPWFLFPQCFFCLSLCVCTGIGHRFTRQHTFLFGPSGLQSSLHFCVDTNHHWRS